MNKRQPSELAMQVASEWLKEQVLNQRFAGDFRHDHIGSLAQRIDVAIEELLLNLISELDTLDSIGLEGGATMVYRGDVRKMLTRARRAAKETK